MKKNNFPDKNEWSKIVEDAFASDDTHVFSRNYIDKKNQMKGCIYMKKNIRIKRVLAGFAAAAAVCASAMIVIPKMSDAKLTDSSTSAGSVKKNSFFISASAEELESPGENVSITQSKRDFFVNGENIKSISLSIDKGELYKADNYKLNLYTADDKPVYAEEECREYIGSNYTAEYDPNFCYGFYFDEETIEKHEKENPDNIKKAIYDCYDDFNGAVLEISVEYENGETDSVSYTLRSGKLELDKETMELNGNFSDGDTPYIYGLYFEKK